MKRFSVWICLAALLLTLCSCSQASMFSEDLGSNYLHAVCQSYSGQRSCELTLSDNACINIQCSFTHKDGTLDVFITGSDGAVAYQGNGIDSSAAFVVQLTQPDNYTIRVEANHYTGSFSFEWETVGAAGR